MALKRARSLFLLKIKNFFVFIECLPCLSLFPGKASIFLLDKYINMCIIIYKENGGKDGNL